MINRDSNTRTELGPQTKSTRPQGNIRYDGCVLVRQVSAQDDWIYCIWDPVCKNTQGIVGVQGSITVMA